MLLNIFLYAMSRQKNFKMSVDVKTPTKAQFEHSPNFLCGDSQKNRPSIAETSKVGNAQEENVKKSLSQRQDTNNPGAGRIQRKRRYSEKVNSGGNNSHATAKRRYSVSQGRNRGERIRLPTNFFLGGNISDPLNLNSLCNEEVSKALNAETPKSSPLPTPAHKKLEVQVIIPPNINDPLNLNSGEDIDINLISPKVGSKKQKKKHRKRKSTCDASEASVQDECEAGKPNIETVKTDEVASSSNLANKLQKVMDKIVSPALPQTPARKRKRNSSEGKDSKVTSETKLFSPNRPKIKKQRSNQANKRNKPKGDSNTKFIHGNYNQYYGKRNPTMDEDNRIKCFRRDWFDGRDVLDIGCNIGHVTLTIARDFSPKKILGMDIDGKLISVARKNVRYYMMESVKNAGKFPASMPIMYGPIAAPPIIDPKMECTFPNNICFVQGNYVLEKDEFLELVKEEYDTVLLLSITKWIHLNFGDDGLKRTFKRIYKQLRPGGRLVVEPQSWASYKKRKNLTEKISKNYQSIRLKPDHFREYLQSNEVGFSSSEFLDVPFNKSKGFQRPIHVYYKPDTSYTTPKEMTESRGVTPLMTVNCTPGLTPLFDRPSYNNTPINFNPSRSNTPHFEISSSERTPNWSQRNTPNYFNLSWSVNNTPATESPKSPYLSQTPRDRTPRAENDPRVQASRRNIVYTGITHPVIDSIECNSNDQDITRPSTAQSSTAHSSVSTSECGSKCSLCSGSSSSSSTDSDSEAGTHGIFSEDHTQNGRVQEMEVEPDGSQVANDPAKSSANVDSATNDETIVNKVDLVEDYSSGDDQSPNNSQSGKQQSEVNTSQTCISKNISPSKDNRETVSPTGDKKMNPVKDGCESASVIKKETQTDKDGNENHSCKSDITDDKATDDKSSKIVGASAGDTVDVVEKTATPVKDDISKVVASPIVSAVIEGPLNLNICSDDTSPADVGSTEDKSTEQTDKNECHSKPDTPTTQTDEMDTAIVETTSTSSSKVDVSETDSHKCLDDNK